MMWSKYAVCHLLNFILQEKYSKLDAQMTEHYTYLYDHNDGLISTPYKNGMLAVARLQDGTFRRVTINRTSMFIPPQVMGGDTQDNRDRFTSNWVFLLKDFNKAQFMKKDDKVYKISEMFDKMPFRVRLRTLDWITERSLNGAYWVLTNFVNWWSTGSKNGSGSDRTFHRYSAVQRYVLSFRHRKRWAEGNGGRSREGQVFLCDFVESEIWYASQWISQGEVHQWFS